MLEKCLNDLNGDPNSKISSQKVIEKIRGMKWSSLYMSCCGLKGKTNSLLRELLTM